MKHTLKITIILVIVFFLAQIVGLAVTNEYIDHKATEETGNVTWVALPYNLERPEIEGGTAFTSIFLAILIGTALVFVLIKFGKVVWWKIWFFLAVVFCLTVSFSAFISEFIALVLAITLAAYKIIRPTIIVHNLTEIFIYGGLAAIFVPILNVRWGFALLIAISIYDAIAVWKSKHMISLAKFQAKSKVFAGLLIPYKRVNKTPKIKGPVQFKKIKVRTAVLGGGDIGFPLIFAGVVMKELMLQKPEFVGFLITLLIPFFTTIALLLLLVKGKQEHFYPAMPFLTAGCIIGFLAVRAASMFF
jgi:presenilin-like A22 family membrane protease